MRPDELTPREAWKRYVDRRRTETTDHSVKTMHYRLKQFVQWCESEGIEQVAELDGWDFERFETYRSGEGIANTTLSGEMQTLKNFVEYLERIEAVDQGLAEKVHVPKLDPDEVSDDTRLPQGRAIPLLHYYRAEEFGSRRHALLELLWHSGARLGAARALDVQDFHRGEQFVEFRHRPPETPLKNKYDGERPVALPETTTRAIGTYLESGPPTRFDKRDDEGRVPLFTSRQGRPSMNTVRVWVYNGTLPCIAGPCPHERQPNTCEWANDNHQASKCPSSRSPHQVRTGSISWQLDQGIPPEVVAKRSNASLRVIKRHYDKSTPRQRMERRRRRFVDDLNLDHDHETDQD